MNYQHLKTGFVAMTLMLLAACSSTPMKYTKITNNQNLTQGHGVVALQLVNNTERLATWHSSWDEVILVRLDNQEELKQQAIEESKAKAKKRGKKFDPEQVDWDPEFFILQPNSHGTLASQAFVGTMPEGEYMISSLYSSYSDGNMSSWITMPVFFSAGIFEVKQSQFTNLGTVVFQPLLSTKEASFWSTTSQQKAYVTRMEQGQDLTEFVTQHYPKLIQSVSFDKVNGWKQDDLAEYRNKLASLSQENSFGERSVSLNMGESNALLSRLGRLHLIDSKGNLSSDTLPTSSQLTAATYFNDQLLVGSERGELFVDQINNWEKVSAVSAKEAFIWLATQGEMGYALTGSKSQYKLYRFKALDGQWEVLGTFKKKPGNNFWVQNGGIFPFFDNKGKIKLINDNKLFTFKESDRKWESQKHHTFKQLIQLKTGELIGLEVSQWDGIGDQVVSLDYGKTWYELDRSLSIFGDVKADATLAAVLNGNTLVTVGREKAKNNKKSALSIISTEVKSSNLNPKSKLLWQTHGQPKDNCHTILPQLSSGQTLYFLCDQGQVVKTDDMGKNWQVAIEVNVKLMQEKYEGFLEELQQQSEKEKQTKTANANDENQL